MEIRLSSSGPISTESCSLSCISCSKLRFKLGGTKMNDYLQEVLVDPMAGCQMAITAENLADKYGISRADAEEYGFRSQTAWAEAHEAGR